MMDGVVKRSGKVKTDDVMAVRKFFRQSKETVGGGQTGTNCTTSSQYLTGKYHFHQCPGSISQDTSSSSACSVYQKGTHYIT